MPKPFECPLRPAPGLTALATLAVLVALLSASASAMCPDLCTCNDDTLIVTCIKAGLEVMPNTLNPRLQSIVYKYNEFHTVDVSLRFLAELVRVDLSHNKIVTISSRAFASQGQLRELKLDQNKIGEVSNQTFYGLHRLEVLSFRGNQIEQLPDNLFQFAKNIQEIDFSRNRIAKVNPKAFQGLTSLRILSLGDNALTSLPAEPLRLTPNLAELILAGNALHVLPDDGVGPFAHLSGLTKLDLSSCRLRALPRFALRGLDALKQLRLADNNLSSVPSEAFKFVSGLEMLDLGRNPFQVLTRGAFEDLRGLKTFHLSGCGSLATIEPQAFLGCVDLEHVSVTLNRQLSSIAANAFDAMPRLHHLSLADNGLQSVSEALVPWRQLRMLDLSGNPWHCDCDLAFVADVLSTRNASADNDVTREAPAFALRDGKCASPVALENRPLADLRLLLEPCDASLRHESIEAAPGKEATGKSSTKDSTASKVADANRMAVIISGCVVAVVLLIVLLFVVWRFRDRMQDKVREWRWSRHDAAVAGKGAYTYGYSYGGQFSSSSGGMPPGVDTIEYGSAGSSGSAGSAGSYSSRTHCFGDSTQPRPTVDVRRVHAGYPAQSGYACDEEHYYYVTTLQNRLGPGKPIPVTEL